MSPFLLFPVHSGDLTCLMGRFTSLHLGIVQVFTKKPHHATLTLFHPWHRNVPALIMSVLRPWEQAVETGFTHVSWGWWWWGVTLVPTMEKRTVNIYSLVWARVGTLILLTPAVLQLVRRTHCHTIATLLLCRGWAGGGYGHFWTGPFLVFIFFA